MKKIFLDDLPRWEEGRFKGKINWKECVGHKVKFIYEDIEDEIEIMKYIADMNKVMVSYKGIENIVKIDNIRYCSIGRMIKGITKDFKINIGQTFKDDKRDLVITDREYRLVEQKPDKKGRIYKENRKWYKYTCKKCGWDEGWIIEGNLLKGQGCSCCSNRVAVLGINTIWDTDRWICDLGVSEEDAKKYTKCSSEKVVVICSTCGEDRNIKISDIYRNKSIGCTCGDGFSYPEKFVSNMLKQINVKFQVQLSKTNFKWCDKYKYDFYLPEYDMIIETHGRQHYERTKGFYKSLEEEQKNDRVKRELAISNGIECYIELDCRYSELDWIKNSVLNSKLNKLFYLSKIDWLECERFALKNIIKEVCDYWNDKEEWETTQTIVENNEWGISARSTVRGYLKKGAEYGWCSYDTKKEIEKRKVKASKTASEKCSKKVEMFKDGESLGVFESVAYLSKNSLSIFGKKLNATNISMVCNGKQKTHKGYTFKYIY